MNVDKPQQEGWANVVVQFPVFGVETADEEAHCRRLQALLDEALSASGIGGDGGEDINSEKANLFLDVRDTDRAIAIALDVLRREDFLKDVVIAVTTDKGFEVRWPADQAGRKFSLSPA
jgi:hypothetical protein